MKRSSNTSREGKSFGFLTVEMVWSKAYIVSGHDPNVIRKDSCGAWIKRAEYGNTNSQHGWEIDHIRPVSGGGLDDISNLQPLQWQNNRHKGDNYPHWTCAVNAA